MKNKLFIEKATKVHADRYCYDLVEYIASNKKVKIICKEHGVFEQIPKVHLGGSICKKCSHSERTSTSLMFTKKASKIHNNKYDYSLVDYKNNTTKVDIICKEHGAFLQLPSNHLLGYGCGLCGGNKKSTTEIFTKNSSKIHNNKYDYSLVDYKRANVKVYIICPIHGKFQQKPNSHLSGVGCLECSGNKKSTTESFTTAANFIHNNLYDYSLVDYISSKKKVKIICKEHGVFEQNARYHLKGSGCHKCSSQVSKPETEVFEFVKTLSNTVNQSNRKIIKPKELDIYCSVNKIAIEFNGLYWHSSHSIDTHEKFKNKHLFKTIECEKLGIKLFHIFENEWKYKKEIWKSILTNAFNKSEFKEVTSFKNISKTMTSNFFKKNSLEESCESGIGYYSGNELIAVLSSDVLVYKLFITSDIKPDVLKINRRTPETLSHYKLLKTTKPNSHFHNRGRFVKSKNVFMCYANNLICIWDCGYITHKKDTPKSV